MPGKVAQKLYSTQILLVQKNSSHSNDVYFRSIDRAIFDWVKHELSPDALSAFEQKYSQEDFLRSQSLVFRHDGDRLVGSQVLQTEKLNCHGLTVRRYLPSCFKAGVCDAYLETSLCIEASRIDNKGEVHFSIETWFIHEPIRGFYNYKPCDPVMPSIVNALLADPNTHGEFVQVKRDEEDYPNPLPIVRYPIDDDRPLTNEQARRDFIAQLTDPLRPVCLIVVFGRGWKCNYATRRLAAKLYSKSCVYHVEELTPDLRQVFEDSVPGIDLDTMMQEGVCRVFFPLGPYMVDDWANPTYPLRIFHINDTVQLVKRGCFASFDIGPLGWRKDEYDVYESWRRLNEERKEESKMIAAFEEAEHRERCDKIIGEYKDEIELLNQDRMDLSAARDVLLVKNKELSAKLARLDAKVLSYESARNTALANSGVRFPSEIEAFPGEIRAHILAAIEQGRKGINKKDFARKHRILEEVLRINPKDDVLTERHNEVKRILSHAGKPDEDIFKELEKLGIHKVSANEHYKVEFEGIPMTLAKTSSDNRHGPKNAVSQMNNLYF